MIDRVVYACDIGTTRSDPSNFGWVRAKPDAPQTIVGSRKIDELIMHLKCDMAAGLSVAIGFESPLFLPVPAKSALLSCGRDGEGNRAWSAPAGAAVTTLGVHQVAWILREVREVGGGSYSFSTDWKEWPGSNRPLLFCWEALVCRDAHDPQNDPTKDSATALVDFLKNERNLDAANAVTAFPRLSLIHAVALWSGWSEDVTGLHQSMLVIQPCNAYQGVITPPGRHEDVQEAGTPIATDAARQITQTDPVSAGGALLPAAFPQTCGVPACGLNGRPIGLKACPLPGCDYVKPDQSTWGGIDPHFYNCPHRPEGMTLDRYKAIICRQHWPREGTAR